MEMEEKYPILADGRLLGEMKISREGPMTVFDADCRMCDGIIRLSVYGGGREGYLGVMMPAEGRLRLHKSLSRNAMRSMPDPIEEVGISGGAKVSVQEAFAEDEEEPENIVQVWEQSEESGSAAAAEVPDVDERANVPESGILEETAPEPLFSEEDIPDELCWYASPDGALVCYDGERSLIALPLGDLRIPANITPIKKTIEGKNYFVYITQNGRMMG